MQREAVAHIDGPLLIMAGAGSGKTKVLTCRIANLLAHGVPPYGILAITFTNKAAAEMRERVDRMIGGLGKDVWLSTFHSFCARFLRREIEAGEVYKKNFVIYDTSDSKTVIKACLKELNLDDKQFAPAKVQNAISNAKNLMLGPRCSPSTFWKITTNCVKSISGVSATSSSTNIRIRTAHSTGSQRFWQAVITISASSAMPISPSTAGAAQTSATS